MRTIEGHFTIVNQAQSAHELATELLSMFESVRDPQHIIITETILVQAVGRAQAILSRTLDESIKKLDHQIETLDTSEEKITFVHIEKAHVNVLEATQRAERTSSKRNWKKLDKARKKLAKELDRSDFASYTAYADFVNAQCIGGEQRRELYVSRDEMIAKKKLADSTTANMRNLTSAQVITVMADVLSRVPRTPVGPLPIVIDDALRNLDVSAKLHALEILKAHASNYATWYVTDDPVVLSWAGFDQTKSNDSDSLLYDMDAESA